MVAERRLLGNSTVDKNNGTQDNSRRKALLRRTGGALATIGAVAAVYGTVKGFVDADVRDTLDARYALVEPTQSAFDQATGAHKVLVDLREAHPEVSPLVDENVVHQEQVLQEYQEKHRQKEVERQQVQDKVYVDVSLMIGGVLFVSGGVVLRGNNRK